MKLLDLTLPTPAENLALDEALLESAEAAVEPVEVLRVWESPTPAVIVGRSSRVAQEVNLAYCRDHDISILRRSSGGAAVVIGPGCFMYSVVLNYEMRPRLRLVDEAHGFVLGKSIRALQRAGVVSQFQGTSDLTCSDRKISGNSMRCKHRCFLYHGTILCSLPVDCIERSLQSPPRQPEYRHGRSHASFVGHVPLTTDDVKQAFAAEWCAAERLQSWPAEMTRQLATDRYSNDSWNLRL